MRTWILVDTPYLAWRAFHTTGGLRNDLGPTGVIFGVLREVKSLRESYPGSPFVFCFDSNISLREKVYPGYKSARKNKELTEDERKQYLGVKIQIAAMKEKWLPELGFKNVRRKVGYEADDIIAVHAKHLVKGVYPRCRCVIVSGDQDLYQLISDRVDVYVPRTKTLVTRQSFKEKYGIEPGAWVNVKAMAGCTSDSVKGIKGVGELTAIKYLKDELPETSKVRERIESEEGMKTISDNWKVVKLPYPGITIRDLGEPELDDEFSTDQWNTVMKSLGFSTVGYEIPAMENKRGG